MQIGRPCVGKLFGNLGGTQPGGSASGWGKVPASASSVESVLREEVGASGNSLPTLLS